MGTPGRDPGDQATPEAILAVATGFMAAKHLFVASEIGLFSALAGEWLTAIGEANCYSVAEAEEWLDQTGWKMDAHQPLAGPSASRRQKQGNGPPMVTEFAGPGAREPI